jgi:hypothetical protein
VRTSIGRRLISACLMRSPDKRLQLAPLLGLLLLARPDISAAQDTVATIGGFPYAVFSDSEAIARWILSYDRVAWVTSDSVLAAPADVRSQLGGEWFCYQEQGRWHAVYGRYSTDSDRYHVVFHYESSSNLQFRTTTLPVDTASLLPLARALSHGRSAFPDSLTGTGAAFNQYLRRLPDSTMEIWYLPAQQSNGLITWGVEVHQLYTADGRQLVRSVSVGSGLRGAYPDTAREVEIDEERQEVPSVGAIFFLLSYHRAFRHIGVWTSHFLSTIAQADSGQLVWIHAVRGGKAKN